MLDRSCLLLGHPHRALELELVSDFQYVLDHILESHDH